MSDSLPASWATAAIGDICEPVSKRGPDVAKANFRYVDLSSIDRATKSIANATTIGTATAPSRAKQVLASGDVLFSNVRVYLENIAQVPDDLDGEIGSTAFCVLRPDKSIEPRYLYHFVTSRKFVLAVDALQRGNSPPSVQDSDVRQQWLPVAPISEQMRIVSKIDELFSRIDEGEAALARVAKLVECYRQSVLKAAVTGELTRDWRAARKRAGEPVESGAALLARILKARRAAWETAELAKLKAKGKPPTDDRWKQKYQEPAPPDTTSLPELPEGWVWAAIEQFLNPLDVGMKTGPFGTLLSKSEHVPTGIPVVGIENIGSRGEFVTGAKIHITAAKAGELAAYDLVPRDVVISRSGTVGELCVIPIGIGPARFSTNMMRIRLATDFNAKFFCYLFLGSPFVLGQVRTLCKGSTRDFLNQHILRSLVFPVPPACEQAAIVDAVEIQMSQADGLISQVRTSAAAEKALRQSILKAAFSGQLVPQDPHDEPASKLLERIAAERAAAPALRQRKKKSA